MSEKMKKLFSTFTIKASEDSSSDGDVIIEGWANKAVVDDVGDLMKFDQVDMTRFKKNPILFYNHDRSIPVGKVLEHKLTEAGLWVKAVLSKSKDPIVSMVRDLVREGILKTFSIGFEVHEEKFNRERNYNEITKWKLLELSVVTLPCNADAEFALMKSLGGCSDSVKARELVLKALSESVKISDTPASDGENVSSPDVAGGEPTDNSETITEEQKSAFQECVSAKVPKLIEEGKPEEQAIAVAMSMCREEGKCSISIMDTAMFDFAKQVAKNAKKPEGDGSEQTGDSLTPPAPVVSSGEKQGEETPPVAVPVAQPSDDPSNFGSPHIDLMKSQLALLGKISSQLDGIKALLEKDEEVGDNGTANPALPHQQTEEASAKGLARIAEIHSRIDAMVKDL